MNTVLPRRPMVSAAAGGWRLEAGARRAREKYALRLMSVTPATFCANYRSADNDSCAVYVLPTLQF
ncbi:hypothetical protein E2C01_099379 [Portunus trituberculatus]|uniref:Uncharacterized protein n=1 Tax=Portunus trituberculatus TaxID=210409 RepID=A0A5B7KF85_PORTR|nr:hypothetical protein [Portunus trituberculatus]